MALSLLICCWSLLVDIRASFAMPIEGGKQITCLLFLFLKHTLFVLVYKQLTSFDPFFAFFIMTFSGSCLLVPVG